MCSAFHSTCAKNIALEDPAFQYIFWIMKVGIVNSQYVLFYTLWGRVTLEVTQLEHKAIQLVYILIMFSSQQYTGL